MPLFYEIKGVDGSKTYIDLDKIGVIVIPSRFGPAKQEAMIAITGGINVQCSINDAEDLVNCLPRINSELPSLKDKDSELKN
jgi:hypothetical protein